MRDRLIRGFERALVDTDRALIEGYVVTGDAQLPATASILAWSIDSVHAFVFDTGNASAIRGASRILSRFDELVARGRHIQEPILPIDPDQILYSGGGGGMAVVPTEDLEALTASLHRAVTSHTLTATCSVSSVPLSIGTFADLKALLYASLARYRTLAGSDATVPVQFFSEECQVCGRRAATKTSLRISVGNRKECALCLARIEIAKTIVDAGNESFDFEDIQSAEGALGVVYLDGNRMGETIANLRSPLEYARFSFALKSCLERIVEAVIDAYGLTRNPQKGAPQRGFQLPILGGDDLVMILPGNVAAPLARDLLTMFEHETDADEDLQALGVRPLGASAGVAVGRLPIRHLLVEAEAFLESAKTRVYRDQCRSCLDFGVVSDGQMRRTGHVAPRLEKTASSRLLLSAKPYDLIELASFSSRRERIRDPEYGIASTQLHACRRMAETGPQQLRNFLLYQIGRHKGWRRLACDLAGSSIPLRDPDEAYSTLVPTYGGRHAFDIADMLEFEGLWRESTDEAAP